MKKILHIEDNYENRLLIRGLLQSAGYKVLEAEDGLTGVQMAIEHHPDLILMDINIPGMDGYEATTKIKAIDYLTHTPIVAITANVLAGDREKSIVAGCDGYMQKPINTETFVESIAQYLSGRKDRITPTEENIYLKKYSQKLVDRLEEKILELQRKNKELEQKSKEMEEIYIGIIRSLTRAIEQKHPSTAGHSERVIRYALAIGKAMGLTKLDLQVLRRAAILHDVGKLVVEISSIDKPGRLEREEWLSMRRHPEIGASILEPLRFLKREIEIIRNHHERPDGKGYPKGLTENELDLLTGILSVADAFDAMTTDRSYKTALGLEESIARLEAGKGTQFITNIVDTFISLLRSGKLDDVYLPMASNAS